MFHRRPSKSPAAKGLLRPRHVRPASLPETASDQQRQSFASPEENSVLPGLRDLQLDGIADNRSLMYRPPNGRSLAHFQDPSTSLSTGVAKMRVLFTDPVTSSCLEADVAASKTAAECIDALVNHGHLGNGDYRLVVNGNTVLPNQSLGEAGVVDGSTVAIHKMETGASSVFGNREERVDTRSRAL